MTGIERKHLTRGEIDAMRDEWVDRTWAEQQACQDEKEKPSFANDFQPVPSLRERFPDGIPRSFAEEAFERVFANIDEEAAADEQREVARRRMAFMRQLRRRPV